jgi:hypothetical protein
MIQEISYAGWNRNLRIQGQNTELVITLDVGPRIIRYAFHNDKNVFVELADQMSGTGELEWMIRGGHRIWTAPEADHSYDLDNAPATWQQLGDAAVEVVAPVSEAFGFQKAMRVEMLEDEMVRVTHFLTNKGAKALDLTLWVLSVMAPGGVALIPQPKLDLHPSEFPEGRDAKPGEYWPNRELILWPFTDLTDGRYSFSENFLRLAYRPESLATKLGLKLPTGWVAYQNSDNVFAKHFSYDPAQPYPDGGCNFEIFTNSAIMELESLAPLLPLQPGATREHIEHWTLHKTSADLRGEKAAVSFFETLPKIG